MAQNDDLLVESQDATWRKIREFYHSNGTANDTWGGINNFEWLRQTPAYFGKDKV